MRRFRSSRSRGSASIVLGLDVIGVIAVLVTPFLGMVHHGVLIEMA